MQGLPPQWSALLQVSGITKKEIAKNPQAMVDVLGFYTEDIEVRFIPSITKRAFLDVCVCVCACVWVAHSHFKHKNIPHSLAHALDFGPLFFFFFFFFFSPFLFTCGCGFSFLPTKQGTESADGVKFMVDTNKEKGSGKPAKQTAKQPAQSADAPPPPVVERPDFTKSKMTKVRHCSRSCARRQRQAGRRTHVRAFSLFFVFFCVCVFFCFFLLSCCNYGK